MRVARVGSSWQRLETYFAVVGTGLGGSGQHSGRHLPTSRPAGSRFGARSAVERPPQPMVGRGGGAPGDAARPQRVDGDAITRSHARSQRAAQAGAVRIGHEHDAASPPADGTIAMSLLPEVERELLRVARRPLMEDVAAMPQPAGRAIRTRPWSMIPAALGLLVALAIAGTFVIALHGGLSLHTAGGVAPDTGNGFPGAPRTQRNGYGVATGACPLDAANRYLPARSGCVIVRRADLAGDGQQDLVLLYSRLSRRHVSWTGAPASLRRMYLAEQSFLRVVPPTGGAVTATVAGTKSAAILAIAQSTAILATRSSSRPHSSRAARRPSPTATGTAGSSRPASRSPTVAIQPTRRASTASRGGCCSAPSCSPGGRSTQRGARPT